MPFYYKTSYVLKFGAQWYCLVTNIPNLKLNTIHIHLGWWGLCVCDVYTYVDHFCLVWGIVCMYCIHYIWLLVLALPKFTPLKIILSEYIDLCFCIYWIERLCRWFCLKITPFHHKIQPKMSLLPLLCLSKISKASSCLF